MPNANTDWRSADSIYDFTVKTLDDKTLSLDEFRGKVLLIVNVASNCAFTKRNYSELNKLHEQYADEGLEILGFPCNQFGEKQASDTDLVEFIKKNRVKWHVFAPVNVNGDTSSPLYKFLKHKCGGTLIDAIKWNFTKFLVDRSGQPVARYGPSKNPLDFEAEIQALLSGANSK